MSLKTYALALTASDETVYETPYGVESTAHSIMVTGSGDLTLKFYSASEGAELDIYNALSISDEKVLEKPINLAPGDKLIASGAGLNIFASVYSVGASSGSAAPATGPGPQTLQAGDMNDGFFGEVSASELFSGDELSLTLGVTGGTSQNSDAGWLKFASNGKILFIAKKSFRHSISWDHIYSRGLVYGTDDNGENPRGTPKNQYTTVERSGNQFAVRLLTGGNADPVDASDSRFLADDMPQLDLGGGSEWNRLMYRIHQDVPTDDGTDGMRQDRHGGPQVGGNWATYTDSDLNISGNGRAVWCQETTTDSSADRVFRGPDVVAYFTRYTASSTYSFRGWRPCLELV